MIAVDTNILVRLLVADDPIQTRIARDLLETAFAAGETCLVTDPVLCELEWVLDSCFKAPRPRIVEIFQEFLSNPHFELEDSEATRRALNAYQAGQADFSDYLILQIAHKNRARATYTFDRALRDAEGCVVLTGRG